MKDDAARMATLGIELLRRIPLRRGA